MERRFAKVSPLVDISPGNSVSVLVCYNDVFMISYLTSIRHHRQNGKVIQALSHKNIGVLHSEKFDWSRAYFHVFLRFYDWNSHSGIWSRNPPKYATYAHELTILPIHIWHLIPQYNTIQLIFAFTLLPYACHAPWASSTCIGWCINASWSK